MTIRRKEILTKGRNIGAFTGGIAFLIFGIIPAFYFGSYGTLLLFAKLIGGPLDPGILVRILVAFGITLALFSVAALCLVVGSIVGTASAYAVDVLRVLFVPGKEEHEEAERKPVVKRHPKISREAQSRLRSRLSFLDGHAHEIHSIVVVGSAAYGMQEKGSDIDIVIICRDNGYDSFREFLCNKEIDGYDRDSGESRFEFTVLNSERTEHYFSMGSPFANAIRNGVVVKDDGYLERHLNRHYPLIPGRKYVVSALYEQIAVQYYGLINTLEREIRGNDCSDECCSQREECGGLSSGETLARTIMRMLYVTLPSKGYMPLTKNDVIEYARAEYGTGITGNVEKVIHLLRNDKSPIYYTDYTGLKPFAAQLYREILSIVGIKKDVVRILRDAANVIRGDYTRIDDDLLRRCVI